MRIGQIILSDASEYERKAQRLDFALLSGEHEVVVTTSGELRDATIQVAHLYGSEGFPAAIVKDLAVPYLASGRPKRRRFSLQNPPEPRYVVAPLAGDGRVLLPEVVDESFFAERERVASADRKTIGTFSRARKGMRNLIDQTLVRIHRFRDDVQWEVFTDPPSPADLARVDAWVDPAVDEDDFDGFVAEALAAGVVVVATRTAINRQRLEKGRCGLLVPPNDPNELTHAILAALFRPEVARQKNEAARETVAKFRPRQRLRVLKQLYETLTP